MIKTLLTAASMCALLSPVMASAAPATVSPDDQTFATSAALGGKTEVATSKLALKKSSNDQLKAFAQEMIDDHTDANKKLMGIAKKQNVMLPAALDASHQAEVDSLKKATGSDFDAKYIAIQEKEHSDAVAAFQAESDSGSNKMLVSFAAKTLPVLQHHVEMLKSLEGQTPPNATAGMNNTMSGATAPGMSH